MMFRDPASPSRLFNQYELIVPGGDQDEGIGPYSSMATASGRSKKLSLSSSISPSSSSSSLPFSIASSPPSSSSSNTPSPFNVKTIMFFIAWYAFTVIYNISNKKFLNALPGYPITTAFLQTALGIPLFIFVWFIRPQSIPKYNARQDFKAHFLISASHSLGNLASIISFSLGSVSFVHVVKAAEPLVAAMLSRFVLQQTMSWTVYLSLLPIVVGIAITSCTEISFSWLLFGTSMASNVFYQLRMVLAKRDMNSQSIPESESSDKDKISASNMFRVITLISAAILLPLALLCEGFGLISAWKEAVESGNTTHLSILAQLILSGISYYIYNEVAFCILELVQPITHAVGNSLKRIVIIIASIVFLSNPLTLVGFIGALIAVAGTLLYSLVTISNKQF